MKNILALYIYLFATMTLYAQVKWIPIEVQSSNTKSKTEIKTESIPVGNLIENVKVIHRLLDKKIEKKEPSAESKKNWIVF